LYFRNPKRDHINLQPSIKDNCDFYEELSVIQLPQSFGEDAHGQVGG
jgi:hypothetical protein